MRRLSTQAGDTIVEVLIAITVLSFILGGAYVVVNRSLNNIRDAQERGEAVTLAQGQLEALRVAGANTYNTTAGKTFCFAASSTTPTANTGTFGALPAVSTDDFATYNPTCNVSPQGGVVYHVAIDYDAGSLIYSVHVRWDRIGSGGKDEVTLSYRMY